MSLPDARYKRTAVAYVGERRHVDKTVGVGRSLDGIRWAGEYHTIVLQRKIPPSILVVLLGLVPFDEAPSPSLDNRVRVLADADSVDTWKSLT